MSSRHERAYDRGRADREPGPSRRPQARSSNRESEDAADPPRRRRSVSRDNGLAGSREPRRYRSRSPNHPPRRSSRSPANHAASQDRPRPHRQRSRSRSPPRTSSIHKDRRELVSQDRQSTNSPALVTSRHKRPETAETKTFKGVVLKYHEPPEARKPTSKNWRLYVFKGKEQLDLFHIHRQSAYLFGRDRVVVDIPIDHPSSSKQHAVIQFRQICSTNEFGDSKTLVKPFIIDLESANGTFVNGTKIPDSRYYELQSGDVIKFGCSTREFVLIPET
ncbi:hypothetical protein PtB15_9B343 [Puccinia triticina]|nr:hypothetical protein PtB15_9B343 [Puccinia triticina]